MPWKRPPRGLNWRKGRILKGYRFTDRGIGSLRILDQVSVSMFFQCACNLFDSSGFTHVNVLQHMHCFPDCHCTPYNMFLVLTKDFIVSLFYPWLFPLCFVHVFIGLVVWFYLWPFIYFWASNKSYFIVYLSRTSLNNSMLANLVWSWHDPLLQKAKDVLVYLQCLLIWYV